MKRPVACIPPVRANAGWRRRSGSEASSARSTTRPFGQPRRVHGDLLERALAAHPARGRRVEAPRAGVAQERAADLDRVDARSSVRPASCDAIDEPLAVEEAERELLVVAGRAHRDGQRRAVDADLQRLLDGDLVALAVAHDDGGHRGDALGRRAWRAVSDIRSLPPSSRLARLPRRRDRRRLPRLLGDRAARRPPRPCTPGTTC